VIITEEQTSTAYCIIIVLLNLLILLFFQIIPRISINFVYQISFRAFWLASWLVKSDALITSKLVNNAFQKEWFGKFVSKTTNILKIVPRKRKKHKMLYWTWRKQFYFWILIELIFRYFVLFIKNLYYKNNYSPQAQWSRWIFISISSRWIFTGNHFVNNW
jgi:hypothetical protein